MWRRCSHCAPCIGPTLGIPGSGPLKCNITQLAALEQAMRDLYGSPVFLALRNHARNQAQAALLKQEIAA